MWPNVEFRDELPKTNPGLTKSHLQRKTRGYAQKTTPDRHQSVFLCRRGLNPRSLIQPSETLPVKLTRTHNTCYILEKLERKGEKKLC